MNLSIVEDISMECITGEIDLVDAQDIRTVLPLTGLERLELKLHTQVLVKRTELIQAKKQTTHFIFTR